MSAKGKAKRFNRTFQKGREHRETCISNQARTDALQSWLNFYNTHRAHRSLGASPPTSRCQLSTYRLGTPRHHGRTAKTALTQTAGHKSSL
ncbi:integrase core domain-containing protein [Arthrobacter sp. FX8]|uniref:integrase core domain-containing protein n=1 Tax=Arthrobacter sp. FX8 TaxID=2997335 RepID=UPI003FA3C428